MERRSLFLALVLLVSGALRSPVAGQQAGGDNFQPAGPGPTPSTSASRPVPAEAMEAFEGARGLLEIPSPYHPSPGINIDGRMDESVWAEAPLLTAFTQFDPVEGIPASQNTLVRVLLTDDAVFFGVRAEDTEKGGVRATLARRDGFGRSDDFVRFILDTYDDQRRAFVFQVNPLGVQGDGLWMEGGGGWGDPIDWNPDFIWESNGRVDEGGYTVEMKIPLKSLRFPESEVQDWGLQVVRQIQRNGFSESWAPLTEEIAGKLTQSGKLKGLRDLRPGRFLELNPVVTATRQGAWDAGAGAFSRQSPTGDFGFNMAYGITNNLTLDGTYNPDFSQVEADAGQIAVNERFALYLDEKRPFFLEGTDVFSMPRQLVYTRSIANPVGAAKLSGKVGSFNVAYIGAVDEVSASGENPVVNLLRLKRDVGGSSSVGLAYTDRTTPGTDFNRVLGADGRFVVGGRYTLTLMAAGSADGESEASTAWGSLFRAGLTRSSRNLSFSTSFEDVSEDFRAGSGFIRRVGITQARVGTGYTWRGGPGAFVESFGPSMELEGLWTREGFWAGQGPQEAEAQLSFRASLRGNLTASISYSRDVYAFGEEAYERLFLAGPEGDPAPFAPSAKLFDGLDGWRVRGWINRWERARISVGGNWGETPIFTAGVPADLGESRGGDLNLTLYPTGSLSMTMGLRHSTIIRKLDGSRYSSATIPRIQGRYQFSRALFLRIGGEYSSQVRGDVLDPVTGAALLYCSDDCAIRSGSDAHDFRFEGLMGYEPSPGTLVYLGYAREMRDAEAFGFREVTTRADGLFLKLSYLLRM